MISLDVRAGDSTISSLRNKYHVVVTADGSVYAQWQVRVCYFHFAKLKKENPGSAAGGFTRLLHRWASWSGHCTEQDTKHSSLRAACLTDMIDLYRQRAMRAWVRIDIAECLLSQRQSGRPHGGGPHRRCGPAATRRARRGAGQLSCSMSARRSIPAKDILVCDRFLTVLCGVQSLSRVSVHFSAVSSHSASEMQLGT